MDEQIYRPVQRSPRRLLKGLLFIFITMGLVAIMVYSPLFTVQRIEIQGNVYLKPDEVEYIARVQRGQRLFQLETLEVQEHLLQDLRIESASVRRHFPDTLAIEITERVPVATVASEFGYVDFDRRGKVIAAYKNLKNVPIPLITGIKVRDLYIGDDNTDANISLVLEFLQHLPQETLNQLSEVNASDTAAVTVYTNKAVPVRLGNLKERLEEKAHLTQDFVKDQETSIYVVEYVDFSFQAPFIRLKNLPKEEQQQEGKGI